MFKFSIIFSAILLFMIMSFAQAQDDNPCAQFTNKQEKNVCIDMMQGDNGLDNYKKNFTEDHSLSVRILPAPPISDLENGYQKIKLPKQPGTDHQIKDVQTHKEAAEQQEDQDASEDQQPKRVNIFE